MQYDFVSDPNKIFSRTDKVMILNMKILPLGPTGNEMKELERLQKMSEHVEKHNASILRPADGVTSNAGFDILCPHDKYFGQSPHDLLSLPPSDVTKFDFLIQCEAYEINKQGQLKPSAFFLFERSSLCIKTPLQLANGTGIIDNGYRGNITGMFRTSAYCRVSAFDRLLQICSPSLSPIYVNIVQATSATSRGEGGFGSTGAC